MPLNFFNILWGLIIFLALYTLILFLTVLIENRKKLYHPKKIDKTYPTVCIIVPFLNEEKTLAKTLSSLINLDYPKNKLEILAIDDGSTDNSRNIAKKFSKKYPIIKILYHKKNKGKHMALNNGIEKTNAEIIGCLDADSIVPPSSLKKLICYFQDEEIMAVAPTLKIYQPKTIFQYIAQAEFLLGIFIRKGLSLFDSMVIIPGPYSFFRKEVFKKIGKYKKAHKTEDMEMTMRLQKNNFKLKNALDVIVYTTGRNTFKELYKERLRWNTGLFLNIWDYKSLFQKAYGDLGILLLLNIISTALMIILIGYVFFTTLFNLIFYLQKILAINLNFIPAINLEFNPLFLNINPLLFLGLIMMMSILGVFFLVKELSFEKQSCLKGLIFFIIFFPWLSFIFITASLYSIIFKKKITWR